MAEAAGVFWAARAGAAWRTRGRIPAGEAETQLTEVVGQRKLLKWSVPGAAHAATFWGFIVLLLTIIEAYGALFSRTFAIPGIGHWAFIGFIEDLFAVGVLAGIITFTVIRLRNDPHKEGRRSRFFGSHTRPPGSCSALIAAVIVTLLVYRGAQQNTGVFPYPHALGVRVLGRRAGPAPARLRRQQRPRGDLHPAPARRRPGVPGDRHLLQAPAHRPGPAEHHVLPSPERAWGRSSRCARPARCSTSRRPTRMSTCSASARSRT